MQDINEAIAKCNWASIINFSGNIKAETDYSNRIYHIKVIKVNELETSAFHFYMLKFFFYKVSDDYSLINTNFASDFIRHLVFETIKKSTDRKEMCETLCTFITQNSPGGSQSQYQHRMSELLEELCAEIICNGKYAS